MQELTTKYDAEVLMSYFARRPLSVLGRLIQVSQQFASLYLSLKFSPSKDSLSDELCSFLSSLGPTFVKLGQTLSTREDLVGKEIARALADLQMAAPPFSDSVAYDVISHELGASPAATYQTLSQKHVAAASLGQVYKGTARTGQSVAVKVQRPDVIEGIALDVYVLRMALGLVRTLAGINSDIRNIADEVGKGLFAELDYTVEATQVSTTDTAVDAILLPYHICFLTNRKARIAYLFFAALFFCGTLHRPRLRHFLSVQNLQISSALGCTPQLQLLGARRTQCLSLMRAQRFHKQGVCRQNCLPPHIPTCHTSMLSPSFQSSPQKRSSQLYGWTGRAPTA